MGNLLCFEIPGFEEVKVEEKPKKVDDKIKVAVDEDKYKNIKKLTIEIAEEINLLRKNPKDYVTHIEKYLKSFVDDKTFERNGVHVSTTEGKAGNDYYIFSSFFNDINAF